MISLGWFLILSIVLLLLFHFFVAEKFYNSTEITGCIIVILCLIFVCYFFGYAIMTETIDTKETHVTTNVISLSDMSETNTKGHISSVILFTYGQVQTKTDVFYRVIQGNDEIGYQMTDLPIDKTRLFFIEDSETPKMVVDNIHTTTIQNENLLFGVIIKVKNKPYVASEIVGYKLYIPKSAIRVDISIDMK
jgi:hypothetical protein